MTITWAEKIFRESLRPRSQMPLPDWAKAFYQLDKSAAVSGTFDIATNPWLEQPLLDFQDPEVSDIFLALGLQLGKSTLGGLCLAFAICEDPGPSAWYHSDEKQLRDFVRGRLFDSWKRSPIIAKLLPAKHEGLTLDGVDFASCQVAFLPILSEANRTGRPLRLVIGDEIKDWPPGAWDQVKKRTANWPQGLAKVLGFSTPKFADDDVDRATRQGSNHRWHIDCPHCRKPQAIRWKQFEWDRHVDPETGEYDYPLITASARIVCGFPECKKIMASAADQAEEMRARVLMLRSGRWIATNPKAPRHKRSYSAPSWINPRVSIAVLVTEYLEAKTAERAGFMQPLQDFYQQRCAQSWGDVEEETALENVLPAEAAVSPGDVLICTADVQQDEVIFSTVTAWDKTTGKSRLVEAAQLVGFGGLADFHTRLGVKPGSVFVDCKYDRSAVLVACSQHGWKALQGEDRDDGYPHRIKKADGSYTTVTRIVSEPKNADPLQGQKTAVRAKLGRLKPVPVRRFSNLHAKDILHAAIKRATFLVPPAYADANCEFARHMKSERKVRLPSGRWRWVQIGQRANHFWDCMAMATAVAVEAGLVAIGAAMGGAGTQATATAAQGGSQAPAAAPVPMGAPQPVAAGPGSMRAAAVATLRTLDAAAWVRTLGS